MNTELKVKGYLVMKTGNDGIVKRIQSGGRMLVLGIETSCDETGIAVVDGDLNILANVVNSQIDIHKNYGGVIPEIASRTHCENIVQVLETALQKACIKITDITKICAAAEPGLPGAVMVGRVFGESLASALDIPYIPVNHLYGHIASLALTHKTVPDMCLLVSGGHTQVYLTRSGQAKHRIKLLMTTADDAVGECFDKVARVLGFAYPGGAKLSQKAKEYSGELINFVSKLPKSGFSFSGLKTAVLNYVNKEKMAGREIDIAKVCAGFQAQAIEQLRTRCCELIKKHRVKSFGICGGVSANEYLRDVMQKECEALNVKLYLPNYLMGNKGIDYDLCGDNGAMIAAAGIISL
jgi:N6-L-threonylcarbamoyladenine synthase